jgi:hypothetical protein
MAEKCSLKVDFRFCITSFVNVVGLRAAHAQLDRQDINGRAERDLSSPLSQVHLLNVPLA